MALRLRDKDGFVYGWNAEMAKQSELYEEFDDGVGAAPAAPVVPSTVVTPTENGIAAPVQLTAGAHPAPPVQQAAEPAKATAATRRTGRVKKVADPVVSAPPPSDTGSETLPAAEPAAEGDGDADGFDEFMAGLDET